MSRAGPLDAEDCTRAFADLSSDGRVVVGVSGGPDSIALLHLLAEHEPAHRIIAVTVDHRLRVEAAQEIELVRQACTRLRVEHRVLTWEGPKPSSRLQEAAREARYALLLGAVRAGGATCLLTAHTSDDQAETVLMRAARGSGPAGLAGMRRSVQRDGAVHLRPLLDVPKVRLAATCDARGWTYVADPSNHDPRFERARWRALMPSLAAEGLTPERLSRLAGRMQSVEEALRAKADTALEAARGIDPNEYDARPFSEEPFEIALRMLVKALGRPDLSELRLKRCERALAALRGVIREGGTLRLSLARRLIAVDASGRLRVSPEPLRRRGAQAVR